VLYQLQNLPCHEARYGYASIPPSFSIFASADVSSAIKTHTCPGKTGQFSPLLSITTRKDSDISSNQHTSHTSRRNFQIRIPINMPKFVTKMTLAPHKLPPLPFTLLRSQSVTLTKRLRAGASPCSFGSVGPASRKTASANKSAVHVNAVAERHLMEQPMTAVRGSLGYLMSMTMSGWLSWARL
jgi:hypothetical protein